MKVTVYFEDNDNTYEVDLFKLTKKLKVTEEQIKKAVLETVAQS